MKSFAIKEVDLGYTSMKYSEWFDFSLIENPEKVEVTLNILNLEMGINDGSVLGVMLQRTIDGVIIDDLPFEPIGLDQNGEPTKWLQTLTLQEGDLDANGKRVLLGNKYRFRYFLSQASINSNNPIPSKATFEAAVLVK